MKKIQAETADLLFGQVRDIDAAVYDAALKLDRFRVTLEELFLHLTRDERLCFASDHAGRMYFIYDTYNAPKDLQRELNALRAYTNLFHHPGHPDPDTEKYLVCLKTLCGAIEYFSPHGAPKALTERYGPVAHISMKGKETPPRERIEFLRAVVRAVKRAKPAGRSAESFLACSDGNGDGLGISFWDHDGDAPGQKIGDMADLAWIPATVHLFDIEKLSKGERLYSTTRSSMVVLEPDYLVDATAVAGCFSNSGANPLVHLLNRFRPYEIRESIVRGTIANHLLDRLVADGKAPFERLFGEATAECALDIAALLHGDAGPDPAAIDSLKNSARTHYAVIKQCLQEFRSSQIHIEPSFISPRYGLQGRLDLLVEHGGERWDVIELKSSGRVPDGRGPWPNDAAQALCYELMLDSTFRGREGAGCILYCSDASGRTPLRHVESKTSSRQNALMVRNRIVSLERRLASGDTSVLHSIRPDAFAGMPGYVREWAGEFHRALASTAPLERAWFSAFASFVAREQWTAKLGAASRAGSAGHAALWNASVDQKQQSYSILHYLEIEPKKCDFEKFHLTFKRSLYTDRETGFRTGDICLLYPVEKQGESRPWERTVLKGTIRELSPDLVTVALRNRNADRRYLKQFPYWSLERDLMESGFNDLYRALYAFLCAPAETRGLILGLSRPRFEETCPVPLDYDGGDGAVADALGRALSSRDYYLVQGPPGTGKTSIALKEIVRHLHRGTSENLMIIAFTNRAVDEICDNLAEASIPFIRLGRDAGNAQKSMQSLSDEMGPAELYGRLRAERVFVSTAASAQRAPALFRIKRFRTLIVDEASQLTEPALAGLLTRFERFILIGDEKQLPAVVTQAEEHCVVDDTKLRDIGLASLSGSLFERLVRNAAARGWSEAHGMLVTQGRMHRDIAEFSNREYYGGRLTEALERQTAARGMFDPASGDVLERALGSARVVFFPSTAESGTRTHRGEARAVRRIVECALSALGGDFTVRSLGVITPFRAQIGEIRREIAEIDSPLDLDALVTVDTVERFQGSQRDIIVVSFALNHPGRIAQAQSLSPDGAVDRKLNVTLTRAREHLVLLGCPGVLEKAPQYAKLLEHVRKLGGHLDPGPLFR
ncbi:MAG TPA: AAA domain-containing protein [Spirochaetota bacterium]|nr:AAA domain-containing protein [Spirochaetota bacterium]